MLTTSYQFVCLFVQWVFISIRSLQVYTYNFTKITETRPFFMSGSTEDIISFIRFLVTSQWIHQKTSSNKLTFFGFIFTTVLFMAVRLCFGLLWCAVFEGPSRPILKLSLVIDGGSHFGEGMELPLSGPGLPWPALQFLFPVSLWFKFNLEEILSLSSFSLFPWPIFSAAVFL